MEIGIINPNDHVSGRSARKTEAQFDQHCQICKETILKHDKEIHFQLHLTNHDAGIYHGTSVFICKDCAITIRNAVDAW